MGVAALLLVRLEQAKKRGVQKVKVDGLSRCVQAKSQCRKYRFTRSITREHVCLWPRDSRKVRASDMRFALDGQVRDWGCATQTSAPKECSPGAAERGRRSVSRSNLNRAPPSGQPSPVGGPRRCWRPKWSPSTCAPVAAGRHRAVGPGVG